MEPLDRLLDADPSVPLIALTDDPGDRRGTRAIEHGAQDYLVKGTITGALLSRSIRYALERHERTRDLARQKEQLEFFNSILQHDLLNGMNVIKMRAELLERELDGENHDHAATVVTWSDNIIDLAEKVRSTIDTLTGEGTGNLYPVELSPVVEREAERVRGMDDDVTVDVDVPPGLSVVADDLLEDVIGNLMTNAVEHNETDDLTVTVLASVTNETVTLTVSDDGSGIPTDDRQRLFERGHTGSASSGTGFGLYFVDSMIETYDGTITVTDSDDGGAAFRIELPAA